MKYGINRKGEKVHFNNAIKGSQYLCPYCTEPLVLRKGDKSSCFAHSVIKGRTPLQRTCPEYHDNDNYKKIVDTLDVIYIENGGIPLYLCNDGNRYELRAHFPNISQRAMDELVNNKTEVIIDNKKWCGIGNLNFYPVYDIKEWIDVKLNPPTNIDEVMRKWLWGIRGIDVEKDIYYGNADGGYRIAIKANIHVGKKYRMLFNDKKVKEIDGIDFNLVGEINLREVTLFVYEITINTYTEPARQFIESKGYKLKKKSSEVIPLWPPSVFSGNELKNNNNKLWFLHDSHGDKEDLYEISNGIKFQINKGRVFKINHLSHMKEKVIIVSDEAIDDDGKVESSSEIKYIINYDKDIDNGKRIKPEILIEDENGKEVDFKENCKPIKGKVYFKSNVPVYGILKRDSFCVLSSRYFLDEISSNNELVIDFGGFGKEEYKFSVTPNTKKEIDLNQLYKYLYSCRGRMITPKANCKKILYTVKKDLNKDTLKFYLILSNWIQRGKIPVDAQQILDTNERVFFND